MRVEVRSVICADYIPKAVDTIRGRIKSAREVNRGIHSIFERKAMWYSGSVEVIPHDKSGIIYFARIGLNGSWIVNGLGSRGGCQIAMNGSCTIGINAHDGIVVIYPKGFRKIGPTDIEKLFIIKFNMARAWSGGFCLESILVPDLKKAVLAID